MTHDDVIRCFPEERESEIRGLLDGRLKLFSPDLTNYLRKNDLTVKILRVLFEEQIRLNELALKDVQIIIKQIQNNETII